MAPALLHVAALALRASTIVPSCPALPSCPQDDKCTFNANNNIFRVSCATDFYGGDLFLAQTSTLASCMKACSTTNGCVAASYVGGNCYMKQVLGAAQENANVIGVALIEAATSTPSTESAPPNCPAKYTCPENNGCIIQGANNRAFALACNRDFYGGDFQSLGTSSFEDCAQTCADNADCVAASFVGGNGPGACYLKSKANGASINDNVDGLSLYTGPVSPSSVTSSSSIVQPTSTSPASVSSSPVLSSSSTTSSTSLVSSTVPSQVMTSSSSSSMTSSPTSSTLATPSPSACTAPTPSACFTITGHGPQVVEGQKLMVSEGSSNPYFGPQSRYSAYEPATYGIWPGGYVSIVSATNKGWYMKSFDYALNQPDWLNFFPDNAPGFFRNVCQLDTATRGFSCCSGNQCTMTIASADNAMPSFGKYGQGLPITPTYDLVTCPSAC